VTLYLTQEEVKDCSVSNSFSLMRYNIMIAFLAKYYYLQHTMNVI